VESASLFSLAHWQRTLRAATLGEIGKEKTGGESGGGNSKKEEELLDKGR